MSKVIKIWSDFTSPTLEITTIIPRKGCVIDCVFCPQRVLESKYTGPTTLSLDSFKTIIDKVPKQVRITFSGFVEPWMNAQCTDMVLYAHEQGHPISIFTTGIGLTLEDIKRIAHIPFAGNPNGGFTLHLPDAEMLAKHPITPGYIKTLTWIRDNKSKIQNFNIMSMGPVHASVKHIFDSAQIHNMWSRSGNLVKETLLKPELLNLKNKWNAIYHGPDAKTCNCEEHLYHNVLLPNGDVSLCCMDYGLDHILGNLFTQNYLDIIPNPYSTFDLCRYCENAVDPKEMTRPFDWGNIAKNEWFLDTVKKEIYVDRVYLKYFSVEKDDIVLDIGASVGPFTMSIEESRPKKVYCFEPCDDLFETLKKNCSYSNNEIVCINKGISNVNGDSILTGMFNSAINELNSSMNHRVTNTTTFETFIKEYTIDKIDFLKTDCEGSEYDIFNDANKKWIKDNVRKIAGEFHLHTEEQKYKFRLFRDTYLKEFSNYRIESMDYVDIKHSLWSDWFISYYSTINIWIDNRE